jgi:hypothetical protein
VLGVVHIADRPSILLAISPHYALGFMWDQPGTTFIILGAVVLCVTGGEALYADMGHFGKKAHSPGLVCHRHARAHAQLFRPGCAVARHPGGGQEPVSS